MAAYYYRNESGSEAGPFDLMETQQLVSKRKILPEYMLRNGNESAWKLAMHFAELDFSEKEPDAPLKGSGLAIVLCLLLPVITAILGLINLGSSKTREQGIFYLRWSAISILAWWAASVLLF